MHSYDDATYTTQVKSSSFKSIYHDRTFGASLEWGVTIGRHTVRAAGHLKNDSHQDHNTGEPLKEFEGGTVSVGVEGSFVLSPKLSLAGGISGDWQSTTRAPPSAAVRQVAIARSAACWTPARRCRARTASPWARTTSASSIRGRATGTAVPRGVTAPIDHAGGGTDAGAWSRSSRAACVVKATGVRCQYRV